MQSHTHTHTHTHQCTTHTHTHAPNTHHTHTHHTRTCTCTFSLTYSLNLSLSPPNQPLSLSASNHFSSLNFLSSSFSSKFFTSIFFQRRRRLKFELQRKKVNTETLTPMPIPKRWATKIGAKPLVQPTFAREPNRTNLLSRNCGSHRKRKYWQWRRTSSMFLISNNWPVNWCLISGVPFVAHW